MNDFNELHSLYHHGIKGQKWGIRRFQNEDGTLTEGGKARYNKDLTKKDPKKMSMEELQKDIARLQAEKNYEQLLKNKTPGSKTMIDQISHATMAAAVTFAGTFGALKLKDYIHAKGSGNALPGPRVKNGKEWMFRNSGKLLASSLTALTAAVSTLGGRIGQN